MPRRNRKYSKNYTPVKKSIKDYSNSPYQKLLAELQEEYISSHSFENAKAIKKDRD